MMRAPINSASRLTQMPKMKVSCNGTITMSSDHVQQSGKHGELAGELCMTRDDGLGLPVLPT